MRPIRLPLLAAAALLVAACAGGPSPTLEPSAAAPTAAAVTRINVTLTDRLTIEPSSMRVPSGVPVTFVVTNASMIDHEFFVGDEAAQAEHEREMAGGGMTHDEEMGIGLDPGERKELTIRFAGAGVLIAGCHVAGHYRAGMKATIPAECPSPPADLHRPWS